MYQEDLELSWRARLRGLRVVVDPGADVLHDYEFGRHPRSQYCWSATASSSCSRLLRRGFSFCSGRCCPSASSAMLLLALRAGLAARRSSAAGVARSRNARLARRPPARDPGLRRVRDRELAPLPDAVARSEDGAPAARHGLINRLLGPYWSLVRKAL